MDQKEDSKKKLKTERQEKRSMRESKEIHVPLHAPNIINVCVDENVDGEMAGRIYHCYDESPWLFTNVIRLVESMEEFFDRISFPQASTQTRAFVTTEQKEKRALKKVTEAQDVVGHRGAKGTFIIYVKYRQYSTWQGEVQWIEADNTQQFVSVLELLKILSNALDLDKTR